MVLVAVLDAAAHGEVDAQRGAVERGLDVVGRQRVAGEEDVDVPGLDQRDHRGRRSRVHDAGTADPEDLLALGLGLTHALGDLAHEHGLRLLAGDLGLHEAETRSLPRGARGWPP